MIRFGVEVSNISDTVEALRKNITDLLHSINERNGELAHVNLMWTKLTLNQLTEQIGQLLRKYEMQLNDDAAKKDIT